jgi:hypothetical protein
LPSIGGSYWTTFFPAIVILGFGMTVTVAPLTTVVMNSIDQDRVGTASGINNAVARVAGVLAIAILGIVMVQAFSIRLNHELNHSSLNPLALQEIRAGENRLAGLQVPAQLDAVSKADVTRMVKNAFVFGFRVVLMICAALSLASAAASWFMLSVIARDSAARNRS